MPVYDLLFSALQAQRIGLYFESNIISLLLPFFSNLTLNFSVLKSICSPTSPAYRFVACQRNTLALLQLGALLTNLFSPLPLSLLTQSYKPCLQVRTVCFSRRSADADMYAHPFVAFLFRYQSDITSV